MVILQKTVGRRAVLRVIAQKILSSVFFTILSDETSRCQQEGTKGKWSLIPECIAVEGPYNGVIIGTVSGISILLVLVVLVFIWLR